MDAIRSLLLGGSSYYLLCAVVLVVAYLINTTYITVFYHRGLAHGAVTLKPWLRRFVAVTGSWVTGIDPKAWACMHRQHHTYSDTAKDPHSPLNSNIFAVMLDQLRSYERILVQLLKGRPDTTAIVEDLDFPVSWVNRKRVWYLPYVAHLAIAIALGVFGGGWLLGACYFFGLMSHPIEGWLVNSFAHAFGYRNFETEDNSRNNTLIAWLVMGEGYQNNHHAHPGSAKFAFRRFELDLGYGVCLVLKGLGLLEIPRYDATPKRVPAQSY
ncbi:Fatty acid desaturase [compost metagenome]